MTTHLFQTQRSVGEQLLAAGWSASSIAVGSKPGSAWVLIDPSVRIRVRMRADLADVAAEVATTHLLREPGRAWKWRLSIHDAPETAIVATVLAAPGAEGGTGLNRRRIINELRARGMRCDRGLLMRALSGTATWTSPDRSAIATWSIPYRSQAGGWQILTPAAHLDATPGTPAAVLAPLINAHDNRKDDDNDN